jgi:uncharacterized membrane protein YebE (DUF533 family)
MAGFTDILGTLIQNGLSKSGPSKITNALGRDGSETLKNIVDSIGNMLGGSGKSDIAGMLGDVLGNLGNNKAALGGLGALGGALLGGGKKSAKGAIGGGALAMLASLAFSALKNSGKKPTQLPRALLKPETAAQKQELEDDANIIVKAMINAAKADGAIDNKELQKIVGKFEENGLTTEEKDFFMSEAAKPLDLKGVTASANDRSDMAAQIYAASYLTIEVDTSRERQYMEDLAAGLKLDTETVKYIKKSLGA